MHRTTFRLAGMDCAAEEQLVRMALNDVGAVRSLRFDLPARRLEVEHEGEYGVILKRLEGLGLGASLVATGEAGAEARTGEAPRAEERLLRQVLGINAAFFIVEIVAGILGGSMGLLADSLDMLADAVVYALALAVVRRSLRHKRGVAAVSGYFQLFLAVLGLLEVVRRFLGAEAVPSFETMIVVSLFALAGNALSLFLLNKSKSSEAHMQASMIFTSNDVIVNCGVIIAGILVRVTASGLPDLVIGVLIFGLVGRGALRILRLSR
jgi:Co/Zn/Cd efflux system component